MNPEIKIEQLGSAGDGIGELDGTPCFVPYSAAGDVLRVNKVDNRGAGILAEIEEIITPSPDRQDIKCRHFGTCGGCSLQHLNDDFVADWEGKPDPSGSCAKRHYGRSDQPNCYEPGI